jgi:DNA repair exonuclease SbcCD nuclease subunit
LERIVILANERKAHFLVLVDDLFARQSVPKKSVERAADILRRFSGEHIRVLADNHDYYEGTGNKAWKYFSEAVQGSGVLVVLEPGIKRFRIEDTEVCLYAFPCPNQRGKERYRMGGGDTEAR